MTRTAAMGAAQHQPVSWEAVMAGIGSLILLSVQIEQALAGNGRTVSERTADWEAKHAQRSREDAAHLALTAEIAARLRHAAKRRNHLVHNLTGASSDPNGTRGDAGYHLGNATSAFLPYATLALDLAMINHLPAAIAAMDRVLTHPHLPGAPHPCAPLWTNHLPAYSADPAAGGTP